MYLGTLTETKAMDLNMDWEQLQPTGLNLECRQTGSQQTI